jgi:uncharacterized protein YndB with AHSA1/START domain
MPDPTAVVSISISRPAGAVWKALTDPDLIREYYLGATVTTDWRVGSPITWVGEWEGTSYEDKGEILAFEPEQRLRYSHWSPLSGTEDAPENRHVVELTLRKRDHSTEVTLTQSNLSGEVTDADRASRDEYEATWTRMLEGLKRTVES